MHEWLQPLPGTPNLATAGTPCSPVCCEHLRFQELNRTEAGFICGGDYGAVDRDILKGRKVQLFLFLHSTIEAPPRGTEKDRRGISNDSALTESIAEIQNCCSKSAVKKSCVGLSHLVPQFLPWRNTVCLCWFVLTVVLPVSLAVHLECPAVPAAPAPRPLSCSMVMFVCLSG